MPGTKEKGRKSGKVNVAFSKFEKVHLCENGERMKSEELFRKIYRAELVSMLAGNKGKLGQNALSAVCVSCVSAAIRASDWLAGT